MCHITPATIAADGQAVGTALNQIATALEATDPSMASKLQAAASALVAATSNWTTGSATADINDAAQVVEAILAAVPTTAPFAGFVAIAVAALDVLIANVGTQPAQTGSDLKNAMVVAHAIAPNPPDNPYHGVVQFKRHFLESYPNSMKRTWNEHVDEAELPGFSKIN